MMKKKFKSTREELLYLCNENGGLLNPQHVVTFAKKENTHLHSCFEWDDEKAAYDYRIWQARQIISLEFEVIKREGIESSPVRLFVSLKDDRVKNGGYRIITDVMNDKEKRKQLIEEALSDFKRVRDKYGAINELQYIFIAIDKAENDYSYSQLELQQV